MRLFIYKSVTDTLKSHQNSKNLQVRWKKSVIFDMSFCHVSYISRNRLILNDEICIFIQNYGNFGIEFRFFMKIDMSFCHYWFRHKLIVIHSDIFFFHLNMYFDTWLCNEKWGHLCELLWNIGPTIHCLFYIGFQCKNHHNSNQ